MQLTIRTSSDFGGPGVSPTSEVDLFTIQSDVCPRVGEHVLISDTWEEVLKVGHITTRDEDEHRVVVWIRPDFMGELALDFGIKRQDDER